MHNFNELNYFITVAKTNSFVKSGKLLGVSSSALSHSMRNLETRLNLRLLNRNTRNVSLTEAGHQLYQQIAPLFFSIDEAVDAIGDFRDTPSGTIRINAPAFATENIIYPKLQHFLRQYPQITIDIHSDNSWVDIVKQGFDMGCRLGDDVAKGMIAVRISDPLKMALVASPTYLKERAKPETIEDLDNHRLVGMRIYAQQEDELQWEFMIDGKAVQYHPSSKLLINDHLRKQAVLDGFGIAWFGRQDVDNEITSGQLIELLPKFAMIYQPFYLYYPSRRGHSNVFKLVIEALKC